MNPALTDTTPRIITNGTQQMELAIQLETDPALTPWLWYSGAYQQYHTALLLLNEVFCHPTCREADRIWACCDYVFETDPALPRDEKARAILSAIQARSAAYRDLRKMRATQKMEGMLGAEGLKRAAAMAADREPHGLRPSTGSTSSGSPLSSGLGLSPHDGTASLSETSSNPAVAIASGGYGESVDLQDDIMADIDWVSVDPSNQMGERADHHDRTNGTSCSRPMSSTKCLFRWEGSKSRGGAF